VDGIKVIMEMLNPRRLLALNGWSALLCGTLALVGCESSKDDDGNGNAALHVNLWVGDLVFWQRSDGFAPWGI